MLVIDVNHMTDEERKLVHETIAMQLANIGPAVEQLIGDQFGTYLMAVVNKLVPEVPITRVLYNEFKEIGYISTSKIVSEQEMKPMQRPTHAAPESQQ